jgi:hypothetical protein
MHQRRLAGAVVADEADALTGMDAKSTPSSARTAPKCFSTPSS